MPSLINSDNGVVSGSAGLKTTGSNDGILAFQNNGTTNVTVTAAGNVGIGTASPGTRVHASIASGTAYTTSSTGNVLTVANTTASGYAGIAFNTEPSAGNAGIAAINSFAPASGDSVLTFSTRSSATLAEQARITSAGLFQFNSGYGSVATAYGCRAWVNFNGASTVSIRASGNVSTITDNGVGNYTVNFSTSLPDASYVTNVTDGGVSIGNKGGAQVVSANQNVGNVQVSTYTSSTSSYDSTLVGVSVFR